MAGLAALVAFLASGCVSLQVSGPITPVKDQDAGSAKVQLWPAPPNPNLNAAEIVSGFLEAARSGPSNETIAADYLVPAIHAQWQSEQDTVIVLSDYSQSTPQVLGEADSQEAPQKPPPGGGSNAGEEAGQDSVVVQVQGTVVGRLDNGLYSADSAAATYNFTVTGTGKGGYRISQLPQGFGVLMERSDFESFYSRHVVYYQNAQQPEALVPTEMYLPALDSDQQVADEMARRVVAGVPGRLSPALKDAVTGADFVSVDLSGDGTIVTIKGNGACGAGRQNACQDLAKQLALSLSGLSAKVTTVAVHDETTGLTTSSEQPDTELSDYDLNPVRSDMNGVFYAISPDGGLEQLDSTGAASVHAVAFGSSKAKFSAVAVEPGEPGDGGLPPMALTGQDKTTVYVPQRQGEGDVLTTVFPTSTIQGGGTVGQLGWDSGDPGALWFTYKLNGETSVYRYAERSLQRVTVTGLPAGARLDAVSPAPDGDRVAVGYTGMRGEHEIVVAAAVPQAGGGYSVDLSAPEVAADAWNSIVQFDWYNEDTLAVLGIQPSSQALGLYQIYADGSAVYDSLTSLPVQASPPSQASGFVWNVGGQPIAAAASGGQDLLYALSVEGQDAQSLGDKLLGTSPSY
jgi:hypothetical protein